MIKCHVEDALEACLESVRGHGVGRSPISTLLGSISVSSCGDLKTSDVLRLCADELDSTVGGGITSTQSLRSKCSPVGRVVTGDWRDDGSWIRLRESKTKSGANVAIAWPRLWDGGLVLKCHGFRVPRQRPADDCCAPSASSSSSTTRGEEPDHELRPKTDAFVGELLKRGWAVAATSYRRDGRCVRDGVADLIELRDFCIATLPRMPWPIVLEGRSMGGAVVAHASELVQVGLFDGAVAIGAALLAGKSEDPPLELSGRPSFRILFLTNTSELGPIRAFIGKSKESKDEQVIVPALWEVLREGHNLVTTREREAAHSAVVDWIRHGTAVTMRRKEVLLPPEPRPPQAIVDEAAHTIRATVASVHERLRSVEIAVTVDDLRKIGVRAHGKFSLCAEGSEAERQVVFSTYPPIGIDPGTFVAFEDPEGFIIVDILGGTSAPMQQKTLK